MLNIIYANQVIGKLVAGGMWFIITLFMTKMIFSLMIEQIKGQKFLLDMLILILLVFCACLTNEMLPSVLPLCLDNVKFSIIYYYIGYLVRKNTYKLKIERYGMFGLMLLLFLILFLTTYYNSEIVMMHNNLYGNYVLFFLGSISGIILVCIVGKIINAHTEKLSSLFCFYGKNTLYYFTMQFIVIDIMRKLINIIDINNILAESAMIFLLSICVLIPVNIFLEKYLTPILKL